MDHTFKSFQRYNAVQQNLTPRNRPILTQNEYLQSVNKLNTILNSLKVESCAYTEPIPQADVARETTVVEQADIEPTVAKQDEPIIENETQPKTPRKRRTKKEIELDLQQIAQKQKDYRNEVPPVFIIEHPPIPPSKPIKPTKPKPPAKVISSTIASVKK